MVKRSPYLKDGRLADVIQAIQVMASYKYYKRTISDWSEQISGNKTSVSYWQVIFIEHPEFFKIEEDGKNVGLILRRTFKRNFQVETGELVPPEQVEYFEALVGKHIISRRPLTEQEMSMLIQTAISLHESAMRAKVDRRWFWPITVAFIVGSLPFLITQCESKKPLEIKLLNEPTSIVKELKSDTTLQTEQTTKE